MHSDGYVFKKDSSRSKKRGTGQVDVAIKPKHSKICSIERQSRMKEVREELQDLDTCIQFKQKRLEKAKVMQHYKECDQLCEETTELKTCRNRCRAELRELESKEKKSEWYLNQKASKGQTTSQGSVDTQSAFSEDLDLITGDEPSQSKITSVENADVDPFSFEPSLSFTGRELIEVYKAQAQRCLSENIKIS